MPADVNVFCPDRGIPSASYSRDMMALIPVHGPHDLLFLRQLICVAYMHMFSSYRGQPGSASGFCI